MIGQLDSASLTEVVNYLRRPKFAYPWAKASIANVTALIISTGSFRIAQSVSRTAEAPTSDYGLLVNGILQFVDNVTVSERQREAALEHTKSWAEANAVQVGSLVRSLVAGNYQETPGNRDYEQFPEWLDTALVYNLPEHLLRLGGPFEREFSDQIEGCLGLSSVDLDHLWFASKSNPRLAKKEGTTLDVLREVFTCSSLLRGKYHDALAQRSRIQIAHHPFRKPILEEQPKKNGEARLYSISNTTERLSCDIVDWACKEDTLRRRIDRYVKYVARARLCHVNGTIDIRPKATESALNDVSRTNAQKIGFDRVTVRQQAALSALLGIGTNFTTSFVLDPWEAFGVGMTAGLLGSHEIGMLAKGPAGRLWHWRGM